VPFVVCVVALLLLCKPGPPLPFVKGLVVAGVVGSLLLAGVLMVPLLETLSAGRRRGHGGRALRRVLQGRARRQSVDDHPGGRLHRDPGRRRRGQALVTALSQAFAVGLATGIFVSGISHALFPDPPAPAGAAAPGCRVSGRRRTGGLQATLVVMPVFVVALTNPALYLAAIMKTAGLGQQAGVDQRGFGRARARGVDADGRGDRGGVWIGLSLWPSCGC
jgi:hypothetical protein